MGSDPSPKNMGIRIAQPFVNVETAEDKDLLFSSSFPMLKEEATGVFNINGLPHADTLVPVYEHKLGYHPFFLVFDDQSKMRVSVEWQIDDNMLYFSDPFTLFPPTGGSGNFRWVIYRLPIFRSFKSSQIKKETTRSTIYSPDYGLKVARKGRDIGSLDLRDFTLHSKGRTPLIDQVDVLEWAAGSDLTNHTVTSNLPYNPLAFGFTLPRSGRQATFSMPNGGQSPPIFMRTSAGLIINSTGNITGKSSIIVFKDPFLSPNLLEIRY
jgi:hypothetical protein